MTRSDIGLEVLLELNGTEYTEENGYWYKIEAWRVTPSKEIPHGIRYNLLCITTTTDEFWDLIMHMQSNQLQKQNLKVG